jgi:hypothetical protein
MAINLPRNAKQAEAEAFLLGPKAKPADDNPKGKTALNIRFNTALLRRIDAAARKMNISRTAFIHVALSQVLDEAEREGR